MDEIPDVVSVRRFKEFGPQQKEELFETLLNLAEAIKDIPKKSLRKTLDVTFAVLQYKGEQVDGLKKELEQKTLQDDQDEHQNERLLDENEKLKQMLDKLEEEKTELKQKIKDLTEELLQQQKRLQDALNTADVTDKDSSDPLSELDKQEELLRNISRKNKHIKRLLKEIETLQSQNIEQSKTIIQFEKELQYEVSKIAELNSEISKIDGERKSLKNTVNELSTEIARLEGNITYLEEERESSERDLRDFIERLEVKAQSWKSLLEEKEEELNKLRKIVKSSDDDFVDIQPSADNETDKDNSTEFTKMMHTLEIRDRQIEQLETKIKKMAEEMLTTTQLMNKLSTEREDDKNPKKPRACCKIIEKALQASNKRCREISEMLERSEEDNAIKSKQALQALSALEAYQRGEDGLTKAIRKCSALEQKIISRDKQIRSLVMQLNSMHEIANENSILRKRLNIPDDVIISTKNLAAKERSKEKMIDRLTLKLRASEEMRLQLKLEKTELRKQLLEMQKTLQPINTHEPSATGTFNIGSNSEIGEVPDSTQDVVATVKQDQGTCIHCQVKVKDSHIEKYTDLAIKPMLADLQSKYQEVLEENETLRFGMHEILENLREYDDSSEHITIDTNILCRLLEALQMPSVPNTPKRLDDKNTKPFALQGLISTRDVVSTDSTETDELTSIGSMRDGSLEHNLETSIEYKLTTVRSSSAKELKITKQGDQTQSSSTRNLQQQIDELLVYRQRYEELKVQLAEIPTTNISIEFEDKVTHLELELTRLRSSYNFMLEDYDNSLTKMQENEVHHIKTLTELRSEIHSKNLEISQLREEYECLQYTRAYSTEEYETLLKSHTALQAQIAFIVERILSGNITPELKINEICADYGIIEDNLQLNFVTAEEYEKQKQELHSSYQKHIELQRKTAQLEGLLEIAQDQIQSQQGLLNEITDNHIDLRHLVADLQSKTEEKHLLAKTQRELSSAISKLAALEAENDALNRTCGNLKLDLTSERQKYIQIEAALKKEHKTKDLKIKFLLLSLHTLKEKYAKFTPLIFVTNFVFAYTRFSKKIQEFSNPETEVNIPILLQETFDSKLKESKIPNDESSNLIKLVKAETMCKILKENLADVNEKCENLHKEMTELRIRYATEAEHWHTIEVLCSNQELIVPRQDATTNTDVPIPAERRLSNAPLRQIELIDKSLSPIGSPVKNDPIKQKISNIGTQTSIESIEPTRNVTENSTAVERNITAEAMIQTVSTTVETQGVQTVNSKRDFSVMVSLNNEMSKVIKERDTEYAALKDEFSRAQKHIEDLQQELKATKITSKESSTASTEPSQECGVIEKTIMSLNTLLMDKDKSISKYQDLLQDEREHQIALAAKLNTEMENLRSTVMNLNFNIKAKDLEILELKTKMETMMVRHNSNEKLDLAVVADENGDNSLNELTDEKIEEMFQQDSTTLVATDTEKKDVPSASNVQMNIKDLEERCKYAEATIKIKEEEITLLREKLKLCQEREKSLDQAQNPEIEKLRLLIEEKDKQINDLMDTLKSFHEDQQNFIKDTSSYSEDQISKLSADLLRTEATNKIYQTQVEALRRQLTSLSQREKQAREQNQSLRNQLIKRPVVSIKTELNTRVKTENMQKRIQQLELELEEARVQIQRQQVVIEAKRAKSASEVGLWEKQKRWQQSAEKFKTKLEETECTLEKTRTLLQSARNTITRLEKEKHILEVKLGRASQGITPQQSAKCCRTPSCPNLNRERSASVGGGKYTPSESPETYTGASSEYSSPSHSACGSGPGTGGRRSMHPIDNNHHGNLIEALKTRIELQQRKILAMELEGKGTNALTSEMEKLQEKLSATEAQNIRVEARNLQLQLDNDLLRQNDATDRLQKRIKHLEDYIIALKEELAQTEANRVVCKCSGVKMSTQTIHPAEQTILSLRNLVEKLKAENKYLKDGRRSTDSKSSLENIPTDINRLQQMYTESLDKVSALQLQLNAKTKCSRCASIGKVQCNTPVNEELKFIKEQLLKKTQLLQKAKVLLTRAAAKEKVLKEQLTLWKRKCSELQNVPVIEEISE